MNTDQGTRVSTQQSYSLSVNDLNTLLRGGIIRVGANIIYLDQQAQLALQQKVGSA